jgi:flagellar biosynthesis anti-sigma factor FlgM
MSIRIDGKGQPTDAEAAQRLESTKGVDKTSAPRSARPEGSSDRVEVSLDAQLVAAAIRAAEDAPAIRPDAVERARRAFEDGTLGKDTDRLADRIIDSLLGPRSGE